MPAKNAEYERAVCELAEVLREVKSRLIAKHGLSVQDKWTPRNRRSEADMEVESAAE